MSNEAGLSRRHALMASVALTAAATTAGCNLVPGPTTPTGLTAAVIDAIQKAVAEGCAFIPNVATLLAIVSKFPVIGGAASITAEVLGLITTFLCSSFKGAGGVEHALAGHTLKMTFKDDKGTDTTAECHGLVWDVKQGKFVSF
jgi:hypothetical protein